MSAVSKAALADEASEVSEIILQLLLINRLHHFNFKGGKSGRIRNEGILINGEKFDSALVTEYLEKAYTTNPAGPNAMKILQNLQQMKRFAELEKIQAESDGE